MPMIVQYQTEIVLFAEITGCVNKKMLQLWFSSGTGFRPELFYQL